MQMLYIRLHQNKTNWMLFVDKDFQKLDKLLKSDKNLKDLLRNPILSREQRECQIRQYVCLSMVHEIVTQEKLSDITKSTLELLIGNSREKRLSNFIQVMNRLMVSHHRELLCRVIMAKELNDRTRKELDSILQTFAQKGEKLNIETFVNSGGMVVEIGDKYIDMSIQTKLKQYTDVLNTNI
ncbi:unnamed protein product [Didymodactylos carnosus]|uniref:Oligomycin sensitivity conferral protein n=1 Tax=Didymodactylos carnosus TaxID=1234261 RepID=A0A814QQU7_9BILA|nr:unnamed protein product [Didymodactylos carnosus]CAF1123626.1 unnamed protein product [Didymodactylos carnosus]CAF3756597.1 unnamed protein product [Didymodactylos carnosus]CAF3887121.1 unnamed protein product [Didymodactylos carnosus]